MASLYASNSDAVASFVVRLGCDSLAEQLGQADCWEHEIVQLQREASSNDARWHLAA